MINWDDFKFMVARTKYGTLNSENVEEVLNRILNEAYKYIDIEEFLSFFTFKGRPKF